jgi:putative transposase
MWTEEHRAIYRREGKGFPSDLRDAEWVRLEPLIPQASPGGRPRKTDMRAAMNAILYLLRTGCPWRYLPREGFPPRSTVYNIFRKFPTRGDMGGDLGRGARGVAGTDGPRGQPLGRRSRQPIAEIGGKGGGKDDAVGYDAGKKVKGRKIHALVDTEGLPMRIVVHSAAIQDRDGAGLVLDKIRRRFPWLELIWADGGYNAWQVEAAVAKVPVLRMEIVKRSDDMKGFIVLPRRWVVERTFSWFGRNRRLAKDFENLAETLATFVTLACIQLAVRRLARL